MNIFKKLFRFFVPEKKRSRVRHKFNRYEYTWDELRERSRFTQMPRFIQAIPELNKAYNKLNNRSISLSARKNAWQDFFGRLRDEFSFDLDDFDWQRWRATKETETP